MGKIFSDRFYISRFEATELISRAMRRIAPQIFAGESRITRLELIAAWKFVKAVTDASRMIKASDFWDDIGRLPLLLEQLGEGEVLARGEIVPASLAYWKQCKKVVCPKAKETATVIPGDRNGVQAQAVGGYLRYLGLPYRKATKIFKGIFDLNLTPPSFLAFNAAQAQNGAPIYETIKESIRHSACVNSDETGWRVNILMRMLKKSRIYP